jgi:hypothetical protein
VSGRQHVTWEANHPDHPPLAFVVALRNEEGSVQTVAATETPGVDLDFGMLQQEGNVRLVVVASDGFHLASDESAPFSIGPP